MSICLDTILQRDGKTTDRQTDRQKDRKTNRQTEMAKQYLALHADHSDTR